jgi:hypothetical protein
MILLREARALLAQHDRALAAVTSQAAASPRTLGWVSRLSCPVIFCRALAELSAAFPQTRVDISSASPRTALFSGRAPRRDTADHLHSFSTTAPLTHTGDRRHRLYFGFLSGNGPVTGDCARSGRCGHAGQRPRCDLPPVTLPG